MPQWGGVDDSELTSLAQAEYGPYYKELVDDLTADFGDRQKAHQLAMQYLEEDRTRGLGRLGTTRDVGLERLGQDYETNLGDLRRSINSRGLYYSGERNKQEGLLERKRSRSEADINRTYDWGAEDLERSYSRGKAGEEMNWGGTQRSYDRSKRDIERQKKFDIESFMEGERQRRRQQFYDEQGYGSLGY